MEVMMTEGTKPKWRKTIVALVSGGIVGFLVSSGFMWLAESGALGTLDPSREIAGLVGLTYVLLAGAVAVGLLSPGFGARFLNVEDADELREQRRMLTFSSLGTAAAGLMLLLLALADPLGPVPQAVALASAITLFAFAWIMGVRQRRHTDELMRAISAEATSAAFYSTLVFGGGWALLAHLGYAPAPAPLDWLTILAAMLLLGTFAICARRGMLVMR